MRLSVPHYIFIQLNNIYLITNEKRPGSYLYGRGFFGLISLIGAFIGIGLIYLGAIKYRNGKLVLIGIAAIFPTKLICGPIIIADYSPFGRSNFILFDIPYLNELVVNIEFYKKEHKVYPDILEGLPKEHEFLVINDPVQTFTKNSNENKFFYKKVGTKYLLFAIGLDGTPFTNDDIFPSSKYFDNTLTGLVRAEK